MRYLIAGRRHLPDSHGSYQPAFERGLRPLGVEVAGLRDGDPIGETDVFAMAGSLSWFRGALARLEATPTAARPFTLVWQVEPLPAPRSSGLRPARRHLREWAKIALRDPRAIDPHTNARRLREAHRKGLIDLVVASTPWRQTYLAEHGIEAEWVPLGRGRAPQGLSVERDIDVLFLGTTDVPRRRRILRRLRRDGVPVVVHGSFAVGAGVWGAERADMLNRTRILLNLARHPGELSGARFVLGMASRALVLSEPIGDPRPFVPGRHYVEAPIEELAPTAIALLADEPRRAAIAEEGYRLATTELRMERSIARIHELVTARLAAR